MIHRIRSIPLLLLALSLLGACGPRHVPPAQLEPNVLFERGMAAYEAGRHGRAIELLQPFVLLHVGDPRIPEARFTLGEAYMARREFVSAAAEFQQLVTDFPAHPLGQPARARMCDAYYRLSPPAPRDQEYTLSAITHCEAVARYYPGTEEASLAQARIAELRERLAQKAYDTGVFYFRRRAFDAAAIYFREAADNFPETTVAPAALLRLHETFTRIGFVEDAAEVRERLLREYPQSQEAHGLRL